jgi:hypothetical protein
MRNSWHLLAIWSEIRLGWFEKLTGNQKSVLSFMRTSPLYAMEDVPLERDKSPTMVSRNSKDFANLGLDVLNPWKA